MVDCPSQFCSHGVLSPVRDGKAFYCPKCGYVASFAKMEELREVQQAVDPVPLDPVLVASAPKKTASLGSRITSGVAGSLMSRDNKPAKAKGKGK